MARPARRPGNLPVEATSFVGRRRELADLRKKLGAARVVSLVGPGGVGKTRLAIRAASDLGRGFKDGAWLVELAEIQDPNLVGNAVMAALDLRDQAATAPHDLIRAYLQDKALLLVLDNCEHLLPAVADLATDVVTHAAGVRILATSREPLAIAAEHVVPVPPMALPAAGSQEQSEAVRLFVERAEAASGTFALTPANQPSVADLCRRLDGLPLALELAAVRTRVLTVEQILERLSDRFALLTGGGRAALPRHQTLETAIDWSHDLLNQEERTLFRRLCVFAGRFTLKDAEAVCGGTLELMSSLVDKSLVIKEDARGVACYRLHETMREYAREKLQQAGESAATMEKCVDHYVTTTEVASPEARFHLIEWLAEMDLEIDNIRAVLRRCLAEGDSVRGIELATSLAWFWINRATTEGVRWLDELVASGPGNPETLAWTYFIRGFLAVLQGDWVAARPALEKGIAAAKAAGQPIQLVNSLAMASIAEVLAGEREAAKKFLGEAERVAANIDDIPTRVTILQARSLNGIFEGDVDGVREAATEGERLSRQVGDLYAQHMMLLNLGGAAMFGGDLATSKDLYERALRIAYQVDDRIGQFYLLAALAYLAAVAGQVRIAAQLLGASDTIRMGAGAAVMAVLAPYVEMAAEQATKGLGPSRYRAEFENGRRLGRDAAVKLALGESISAPREEHRRDGALGKREDDVVRLVAEGLSNKQIASRLFISERTVDSHVRSILNKLGFNSRAQIAAWMASSNSGYSG
jgi:predicted ATPase/DNA-binding CsgD family transcriptional regulator